MNTWQLEQELFEETRSLEAGERARLLAARGDAALARRVERLVAADATPLPQLEGTAAGLLAALRPETPATELCGQVFGDYTVEAHVSSGGMAHVYRATRRRAGTERRVALKVLRPGLDSAAFLERFARERRTLAALEHEHVVTFLDADALPDGRPFLVMEYVEGVPLTAWCAGVPVRRRVELFGRVLAAVQHAHQRLVVHRDLKPSNVLVTAQGAPRLLDFGVATVLDAAGTAPESGPLTPEYASPEQLHGEPLTTASDVYSLGVLLHEVLTGELPGAGVEPAGDLGAVCHKALAARPEARYASAGQMADDLARALAREPVAARPATWSYRARLFARRNVWPLALAAALVALPVAGWIGTDLERRRAEEDAGHGWGAHAQARMLARVYEDWLVEAATDPAARAATLARLEEALAGPLAGRPEAEVLARLALARLYLADGALARASAHSEQALARSRTTGGIGKLDLRRLEDLAAEIRARQGPAGR